jgi:hypothetical protein
VNPCFKFFALALSIATVAHQAHAQPVAKRDPATGTAKPGSITGRVLADGQAVVNASVTVTRVNAPTAARFVPTNDNGDFEVKALDAGVYRVRATAPGYVATPSDADEETYYRVGDAILLTMIKGSVITGKVTNANNEPVVAVRVRALMIRDAEGKTVVAPDSSNDRLTDDRGIYRIFGLRPGTYVVYAGGRGSTGYGVNAFDNDAPTYAPSSTRDTAAEIALASGEEQTIDIRYRAETGHSVSGSAIANANNRQPWITIRLARLSDGAPDITFSTQQNSTAKGFEFQGVADGEYLIWAQYSPTPGDSVISEARRITVRGADVTGIELITKPLATVAGDFILEQSKIESCKGKRAPAFDETVVAIQRKPRPAEKDRAELALFNSAQAIPDASGHFILRNLSSGAYDFDARFFSRYWYLRSIQTASTAASTRTDAMNGASPGLLSLKAGESVTGIKIVLAEGAASLAGQVQLPKDEKLDAGAIVYLVPAEKEAANDALRFFITQIHTDGSFEFNNLPPGRYWSIVKVPNDKDAKSTKALRLAEAADMRAKLRNEAAAIDHALELHECQNLSNYQLLP